MKEEKVDRAAALYLISIVTCDTELTQLNPGKLKPMKILTTSLENTACSFGI